MIKFCCCFLLAMMGCRSIATAQAPALLPAPQKLVYGKDKFALSGAGIQMAGDSSDGAKKQFIADVKSITGISLLETKGAGNGNAVILFDGTITGSALALPGDKAGADSREAYRITVDRRKITVTARSPAATYYALQTLRQLIVPAGKDAYLPELSLEDYPAFAYRGIMMDFAHGGLLTEEEIERQIDFLARWKINQYYFYNEVSIEMKGYPLMNYQAKYTQDQIRRIVQYGRERYVDVIPFVNFYGHLHELMRLQKYAGLAIGEYEQDLDPRLPEVQTIIKDWIRQYSTMFSSPFIHVGFDETAETGRLGKTRKDIHPEKLYLDHLAFVTKTLQQSGKTVMVWTDISRDYPGIIARFPKGVVPVVWDYGSDTASINRWIRPIVKENIPFFMQSAVDGWAHLYPTETTWNNIDLCLNAADKNNSPGYITSVWTDAVQPLLRNTWLFMAYGSVTSWQNAPVDRKKFIGDYCRIMYPGFSQQMSVAFEKLAESQVSLRKCLGQTQTHMWENPFSADNMRNTNKHLADYINTRLTAEIAQEALMAVADSSGADGGFIKTLLLNCRLLSFTAMRYLWAKKMIDAWDSSRQLKNDSWYSQITETPHGLLMDMLDYTTEIKEEYRLCWLSENMPYRMGTITGRFDADYLFWRTLSRNVLEYRYHAKENKETSFQKVFQIE